VLFIVSTDRVVVCVNASVQNTATAARIEKWRNMGLQRKTAHARMHGTSSAYDGAALGK